MILAIVNAPTHGVTLTDALKVWARVAALSFGGPAGQIAMMHRILVEEKRWMTRRPLQDESGRDKVKDIDLGARSDLVCKRPEASMVIRGQQADAPML